MRSPVQYVSVYVPEYSGQRQNASNIKSKVMTIRRCWNRLSRLQKSFLFMSFLMFVIFSMVVTTLIWVPQPNNGYIQFSRQSDVNVEQPLLEHIAHDRPLEEPALGERREGVKLHTSKYPEVSLSQTVQPGEENMSKKTSPGWGLKDLLDDKKAEDIRHVISLDPVIPIHSKKSDSKLLRSKLRFDGPANSRQKAVVDAFVHAWNGYRKYAWGRDHLRPISGSGGDWFGLGLTLVDSLDTLCILNLQREFFEARDWVDEALLFNNNKNVNLFETTIRVLGGLLSAFHLSKEQMFLTKAQDLGSRLLVAFRSPSGIPYSDVNLKTLKAHGPAWNPDSSTSEVSTIQLEFRDLARLTNISLFENAAMNVSELIHKLPKYNGLVPIHISPNTGEFRPTSVITLGARGDSYYEYLLKQWIQTGKKIDFLKADYLEAIEGVRNKLVRMTSHSNLTYVGELEQDQLFRPKMDHLVCYLPGTLALGYYNGFPDWHLDLAKSLLYTCYQTYIRQPTGLAPEITYFRTEDSETDFFVKSNDAHNLLRPETIESLWYLHEITGNKIYQDWGYEIFESFMKYTKANYGFSSISSVLNQDDVKPQDMMESFFLAETLKYFYLLFSDKPLFNLNEWIFNSEGHPLPAYDH